MGDGIAQGEVKSWAQNWSLMGEDGNKEHS